MKVTVKNINNISQLTDEYCNKQAAKKLLFIEQFKLRVTAQTLS